MRHLQRSLHQLPRGVLKLSMLLRLYLPCCLKLSLLPNIRASLLLNLA